MEFVYNNSESNPTMQFTYNNSANPESNISESYNFTQNDEVTSTNNLSNNVSTSYEEVDSDTDQIEKQEEENVSIDTEKTLDFDELRKKYVSQLNEIKTMGFEDENNILKKLALSRGSVSITINKLLSD